ncbi:MAG: hypothetical protein JWL76_1119 [Thermoleophilia bacterium]|nr:hypothetical protein [Thermoleophilia bacterium]
MPAVSFDGTALSRAMRQLDVALSRAEGARSMEVPLLFARRDAVDGLRATLGDAADWTHSALADIDRSGVPVADARFAIDRLAEHIDGIRWERGVVKLRAGEPFRIAIEDARRSVASLETVRDGAVAIESGHAVDWLARTLEDPTATELSALADLSTHPAIGELGRTGEFVRRIDAADPRSVELAHEALTAGPAEASHSLLTDQLRRAREGRPVDVDVMRRALQGLDDGAGDGARRLPTWIHEVDGHVELDDLHRSEIELLADMEGPEALKARALQLLEAPLSALEDDDLRFLATLESLPDSLRPAIGSSETGAGSLASAYRSSDDLGDNVLAMWANTHHADGTAARAAHELLAADEPDVERAWRLAELASVDADAVFGAAGSSGWRSKLIDRLASANDGRLVDLDVRTIRTARGDLGALPTDRDVARHLAAPNKDAALPELAAWAALPTGQRPPSLDKLASRLRTAVVDEDVAVVDDIAWRHERAALLAAPAATKVAVSDELASILSLPDDAITEAHLHRIDRLTSLPARARPDLPEAVTRRSWSDLALRGGPEEDMLTYQEVANLRTGLAAKRLDADPSATRQSLEAELDAILAKPTDDVDLRDMQRIATFERMPSGKAPWLTTVEDERGHMGRVLDQDRPLDDDIAHADFEQLRVHRLARRLAADPTTTKDSVLARLDVLLDRGLDQEAVDVEQVRFLAAIENLPKPLRPKLPATMNGTTWTDAAWELAEGNVHGHVLVDELDAIRRLRDRARIIGDPSITRDVADARLDAILLKPDADITQRDLDLLVAYRDLPKDRRPHFPRAASINVKGLADEGMLPSEYDEARIEFDNLRRGRLRERLLADPSFDPARATARLDELLDTPDGAWARHELSAIAALSKDRRPQIAGALRQEMQELDAVGDTDYSNIWGGLRTQRLQQLLAQDPPVDPEVLERAAVRVGLGTVDDVSFFDLHQLALLDELPTGRRPAMPETGDYSWREIADGEWLPSSDGDARAEFDKLRRWATTESPIGRARVIESVKSGTIDRSLLTDLTGKKAAARATLTDETLLSAWLQKVSHAGYDGTDVAERDLLQVRKVLTRMDEVDPALKDLLKDARRLVRRNLERLDGERPDGYDIHPEYAELGRLQSQGELLARMRELRATQGASDAVTSASTVTTTAAPEGAAVTGTDVLTW